MTPTAEGNLYATRGRRFLSWTRQLLVLGGLMALTYVAYALFNARLYQQQANDTLDQELQGGGNLADSRLSGQVKEGDLLGRIEIPRIDVSVAILQGTKSETLQLGVGHIQGTPLPGEGGNVGIAGHRDSWFRSLKDIQTGDDIQIETPAGLSQYRVDWVQIVAPGDMGVLASSTEAAVTLVTCYPFYYVGPAPERFVVHARKI